MNEQKTQSRKDEEQWDALFFGVKRTVRYHLHRRRFFATWKAVTDFLVIASGSTVVSFASVGESKRTWIVIAAGATTAIFGTLDLVLGFSDRARDHRDLVEKFSDLEAEMTKDAVAKERFVELNNKRLKLEVEEPPIKRVLNMFCHNELVIAMGYPAENLAEIKRWQSLLKQFIDLCPERIKTRKQIEDARLAEEKARTAALAGGKAGEVRA